MTTHKTHQTYNKNHIYFLLNCRENYYFKIGDKTDLIKFVTKQLRIQEKHIYELLPNITIAQFEAYVLGYFNVLTFSDTHDVPIYRNKYKQYKRNNLFTNQNLTYNDTFLDYVYYNQPPVKRTKEYMFFTGGARVFDIRLILDDVYKEFIKQYLADQSKKHTIRYLDRSKHHRKRPISHTIGEFRAGSKTREQRTKETCLEQGVKYRYKALPPAAAGDWDVYRYSRRSSGWKDHKYPKQWQHNIDYKKKAPLAAGRHYFKNYSLIEEINTIEEINAELYDNLAAK